VNDDKQSSQSFAVKQPMKNEHHSPERKRLEKQLEEFQKQLQKVKNGKEDQDVKRDKIKKLEDQIRELQNAIQEQVRQEKQNEMEDAKKKMAEKAEIEAVKHKDKDEIMFSPGTRQLISASVNYPDMKTIKKIKNQSSPEKQGDLEGKIIKKALEIQQGLLKYQKKEVKLVAETEKEKPLKEKEKTQETRVDIRL
jgi:hypothetical protein